MKYLSILFSDTIDYLRPLVSYPPMSQGREVRSHYGPLFTQTRTTLLAAMLAVIVILLTLYKVVVIADEDVTTSFWSLYGLIVSLFLISRLPLSYLYTDEHRHTYDDAEYPSVSFVIAAKNEEAGILRTIFGCLNSNYPAPIECIVIDDGSTDGTRREIERAHELCGSRMRLITFDHNRGKKEAISVGIEESKHDIIVFVDSDSFIAPDSLKHITEHFIDHENIGAVSGNTRVENKGASLLTKMQSIQYAISFNVYKASESVFGAVSCCPGCFSAYRRSAIQPVVHAWRDQTFFGVKGSFGDDRSLTNFVLQEHDVVFCEKAIATTIVPDQLLTYLRQQLRWKKSWIREGVLGGLFMWKKHPVASVSFYINFTFPFIGPLLAGKILWSSITHHNPALFLIFASSFIAIGLVFAMFVRVLRGAEHWAIMPIFSVFFITALIWQMPYALLTLRDTRWGTR